MPTKAETTMARGEDTPKREFPFPCANFDPLSAQPSELSDHGLPQRPDGDKQPELLAAWLRLFEKPLTFQRQPANPVPDPLQYVEQPQIRQTLPDKTRFEGSSNWCGASIVPNGGKQFVLMFGEWTVPTPQLPPPSAQGPAGARNAYHCSTWIGFDGNRRYRNSTLPQIGTEQILTVDPTGKQEPRYLAWYQWWARDQVALTRSTLSNMTIDAGVSVMAMISVIDPYHVVMVLRTFAPLNQITILVEAMPDVWLTDAKASRMTPAIAGATAEWILERPETLDLVNPKLELFAKYDPVQFRHCVAGTGAAPGAPTGEETLAGARLFRLFDVPEAPPPRIRLISLPRRISTSSIDIRYGGFPN